MQTRPLKSDVYMRLYKGKMYCETASKAAQGNQGESCSMYNLDDVT